MAARAVLVVVAPGTALALQELQIKALLEAMVQALVLFMAAAVAEPAVQASMERQAVMVGTAWLHQSQATALAEPVVAVVAEPLQEHLANLVAGTEGDTNNQAPAQR